jgi:hypothetical protein
MNVEMNLYTRDAGTMEHEISVLGKKNFAIKKQYAYPDEI